MPNMLEGENPLENNKERGMMTVGWSRELQFYNGLSGKASLER